MNTTEMREVSAVEKLRGLERLTEETSDYVINLINRIDPEGAYTAEDYARWIGNDTGELETALQRLHLYETHVPALLDELARLQSELAEARERAEAAEGDLRIAATEAYGECMVCSRGRGGVPCSEDESGKCNWQWRGPRGREGAAIKPSDLAGAKPIIDNMPGFKREVYFPQEGAEHEGN
jgi:hypothetical protein